MPRPRRRAHGSGGSGSRRSGPLVAARDVGVRRGERWLIRHVDLQVPRGELVYLIGANGAGKSTCAKSILGLIEIDEGTIERARGLAVGYVPQRLAVSHTLPLSLRRLMKLTGRFPARDASTPRCPRWVWSGSATRRSPRCRAARCSACCSPGR